MAEIFSERHRIQCMLDFEAALARASVAAKIAPAKTSSAIKSECEARLYDIRQIVEAAGRFVVDRCRRRIRSLLVAVLVRKPLPQQVFHPG